MLRFPLCCPSQHGLTAEEMQPYIARVLIQPENWMIHAHGECGKYPPASRQLPALILPLAAPTALLLKCKLELEKAHTRTRSIMQLQALVDQYTNELTTTRTTADIEASAPVQVLMGSQHATHKRARIPTLTLCLLGLCSQDRMAYMYALAFPARWGLQLTLGRAYLSQGAIKSALKYFSELQVWDAVISCYVALSRPKASETLLRDRIAQRPTAALYDLFVLLPGA